MSEYDYLNARVRGMSTALLAPSTYDQLLGTEGETLIVDTLLSSSYGDELRDALSTYSGVEAVTTAIRRQIHRTFTKLQRIAPGVTGKILSVQFNRWDVANVMTIIRGVAAGAEHNEIMEAVLPVGELHEAQLSELASERSIKTVADALATWNYTFAETIREAVREAMRAGLDAPDLQQMDESINRAYFAWALEQLRSPDRNVRMARSQIQREIDLVNIKGMLDVVHQREKGSEPREFEPIEGGTLSQTHLDRIAACGSLEDAFEVVQDTYFFSAIEKGILAFGETRNLAVMERFLENVVIEAGCRYFREDPLTVAVPLGYIWRQYNEFLNLQILVRGKRYRMPANAIREELLFV